MLVCAFDTTTPLLLALPEIGRSKVRSVRRDRWLGKQVRSFGWTQLFAYLFADGAQRWNRRYWRAFRPRRENPQREKVSIDCRAIYVGFSHGREMGRGARLFRILSAFPVFCLDWFLFRTLFFFNLYWVSISGMNDVWYCCERNLFRFFLSFFFLKELHLSWKEIISSYSFSLILRFLLWEFNSINFVILIFDFTFVLSVVS